VKQGSYRVVVWSTGGIGSIAIHAIRQRSDLELVGVWVHSPHKVGRDAGELAGGRPIGVPATNDMEALIALKPDCVVYAASGPERDTAAVRDYVRLLAAGINVVTTTSTQLVNPATFDQVWRDQLAGACKTGNASIYASGIEPGFVADQLALVLTTQSKSIRKIHSYEIALYDDYAVPDVMINGMGFGKPLDFEPWIAAPNAVAHAWRGQIGLVARGLGVKVQEIRETFDRRVTDRDLEVAFGSVKAGTCGALRMQAIGIVEGQEAIVVEHVTRLSHDVAPEWPKGVGDLSYRIVIAGEPCIDVSMEVSLRDPAAVGIAHMSSGAGAMVSTAMRVVNAVPFVVDAPPGLLCSLDLPLTLPRGVFPVG